MSSELGPLLTSLVEAKRELDTDITEGLSLGSRMRDAVRVVGSSSSNSWVGWHSRMYFGDFAEPSVHDSWDVEWGGINGYSSQWRERSQSEIQKEVESRAGLQLRDLAVRADQIRERCEPLRQEVLTVLSPLCDLAGLESESKLLGRLEELQWLTPPADYVEAMMPRQVVSRDSVALHQGLQPPLHLNVEAAVVANTQTISRAREFLDGAIRLVRQVQVKLTAYEQEAASRRAPMEPAAEAAPAPTHAQADERITRRLRRVSLALSAVLVAVTITASALVLRAFGHDRGVPAATLVCTALLVAAFYAALVSREHAVRALVAAAGLAGAVAAVDQLITPLFR